VKKSRAAPNRSLTLEFNERMRGMASVPLQKASENKGKFDRHAVTEGARIVATIPRALASSQPKRRRKIRCAGSAAAYRESRFDPPTTTQQPRDDFARRRGPILRHWCVWVTDFRPRLDYDSERVLMVFR
jgi:hypothetical protein